MGLLGVIFPQIWGQDFSIFSENAASSSHCVNVKTPVLPPLPMYCTSTGFLYMDIFGGLGGVGCAVYTLRVLNIYKAPCCAFLK